MKIALLPGFFAGVLCATLVLTDATSTPQEPQDPSTDMAAMMANARKYTQPGEHHKILEKYIGTWDTEFKITMAGFNAPAEKGVAEVSWLIEGRWLKTESKGTMMGQPMTGFSVFGYDNFKMSYVVSSVSSMDTAMHYAEGDMDPSGKSLIMYGTLDEYLTGEHDKMVKTVWRYESDDKMIMEIHDLPIGEKNTKVVEIVYTRKK